VCGAKPEGASGGTAAGVRCSEKRANLVRARQTLPVTNSNPN
jgi:hypothetical protein